jgi:hypothetical protein
VSGCLFDFDWLSVLSWLVVCLVVCFVMTGCLFCHDWLSVWLFVLSWLVVCLSWLVVSVWLWAFACIAVTICMFATPMATYSLVFLFFYILSFFSFIVAVLFIVKTHLYCFVYMLFLPLTTVLSYLKFCRHLCWLLYILWGWFLFNAVIFYLFLLTIVLL